MAKPRKRPGRLRAQSTDGSPKPGDIDVRVRRFAACHQLTCRERQITRLLVDGGTNAEIAREMMIAPGTVKSHVEHILVKTSLHSRHDVARVVWSDLA